MIGSAVHLEHDWYPGEIPANVVIEKDVYFDTSYGFTAFFSERHPGLTLHDACGVYDLTTFIVGPRGQVTVGAYTCLNNMYLICNDRITIGAHCLLAWGVVLMDSWPEGNVSLAVRRALLRDTAGDPARRLPPVVAPRPVTLEDNVWVGFNSVILPGVTLGRGCVVGCNTVVAEDVPPYAVVAGDPPRIVRFLAPDDGDATRERTMRTYAQI